MSTMHAPADHIRIDETGRAQIAGTSYPVLTVVADHVANGLSPEEIYFEHYEEIPLGGIYAALAYYYDNRAALDAEIREERRDSEAARQASGDSPFVRRMRVEGRLS